MAPGSKAEKKAALDAGAWMFNVVTSVGIIMVNKALMATHGFSFGKNTLQHFGIFIYRTSDVFSKIEHQVLL
uniref:Uncharacterized protein n=1 Tax=Aegilops tauschii subsp. strangulata TaxID=200361 RepID=A0A453CDI7_AEGTS